MFIVKHLRGIILLLTGILMSQTYSQPANLVLQDTTIATTATFTASNSITAGPNFTIASSGDATFVTGGNIYFRPEILIIQSGMLKTISDSTLVNIRPQEPPLIPARFVLQQNYPNPFNPVTNIEFSVPNAEFVTLKIYNTLGQEVAKLISERLAAGEYKYEWDASGLASGVYLYRIEAGEYVETKKMILMR
ncbi:MAG: T9SS type A sorting domain-containing protein [Aliifodinibius sp.]|nr:T9SS type A sorting domain-containing protein [Fodinibius sp.]NIV15684.1 T9SS type A sorting domain-containing protein [Fodinibius sp.]NIY29541.1 T9SS type A sorting domain-containing protein [Fodinibius sp.]